MNNTDLKQIVYLMDNKLKGFRGVVREEISKSEKRLGGEISASEKRLQKDLSQTEQKLKEEISASDRRVMGDIGQFMEDNLFPMIDEKADKSDIDRLERKLDRVIDTNLGYDQRFRDIERVPVIAHELKFKKPKVSRD